MNLKSLLIPLLLMSYTPTTYADEGLDISYKVPFLPLEVNFGSDGILFRGTKTIVTPIGSFSLGYSKYASKFDEDYTYVIIEDMNLKKEHIYKIKDKKKLKLVSEGITEITITKNRVRIVVEKGSRFTVKFSVEGEDDEVQGSSGSGFKWFSPTDKQVKWKKAKELCEDNGGRLPTIEELKEVITGCGGRVTDHLFTKIANKNERDKSYQSCYKNRGFNSYYYWSSSTIKGYENFAWIVYFGYGGVHNDYKDYNLSVYCVRDGQ